jgi:toxin CptA
MPLLIEPRASASSGALFLAAHFAALAALFLAHLPAAAGLAGLALLVVSFVAGRRRSPPPRLRCKADGQLEIQRDAAWQAASLLPDSVALPWLIVLRWRENGRRHSLALPPDALSEVAHRRLRVWLRWKSRRSGAGLK